MSAPSKKTNVHVYSTYGSRCGIASFAATIEDLLQEEANFTYCVLDPFVFRSRIKPVNAKGDQILRDDAANVAAADVVHLQFEPGLLGEAPSAIVRRLTIIIQTVKAHRKRLVVTNHTVFNLAKDFSILEGIRDRKSKSFFRTFMQFANGRLAMPKKIYSLLAELDAMGLLTMVAHNKRDRRYLAEVWRFSNVVDHPLQHLRTGWAESCILAAKEMRQTWTQRFGQGKTFVGTFGFLADYKGYDTAIRAMRKLPEDYVLLIFGGVHPNTVVDGEPVNSHLAELMSEIEGNATRSSTFIRKLRAASNLAQQPGGTELMKREAVDELKSITDRVHFMGSPEEYEFACAIAACDVCLFPYREVGQSASGPMCYAIELGRPVIASTTGAFRELDRYFPGRLRYVDIGNHLQLAGAVRDSGGANRSPPAPMAFTHKTMAALYRTLLVG
jgi:glycosyltransferase involved in cell wall biosynthesis